MKDFLEKIRIWLLKKLFTENEKYILLRSTRSYRELKQTATIFDRYQLSTSTDKEFSKTMDFFENIFETDLFL